MSWGPKKLLIRCSKESHHPAEWASGWAALENEKDTTLTAVRVGVNILQFYSVSNSLSHANVTNKVRGTYLLKKSSLVLCHCVVVNYSACICIWLYNTIQLFSFNRIEPVITTSITFSFAISILSFPADQNIAEKEIVTSIIGYPSRLQQRITMSGQCCSRF